MSAAAPMKAPTLELRQRFDALAPSQREHVLALLENGRAAIEFLGGGEPIWRDAWEAALEAAESAEGRIR